MPLTRQFKTVVRARAQRDARFRAALLQEAVEAFLQGETADGKASLRTYINATIGFVRLGRELGKRPQSLMRMLSAAGNPTADNLFALLVCLQEYEGVRLNIESRPTLAR